MATGNAPDFSNQADPLLAHNFFVEVDTIAIAWFNECSGIGSEHEVVEHKAVDSQGKEVLRKIPGRMKWQDVVLKRGITNSKELWDWRQQIIDGKVDSARRNFSIAMVDQAYNEIARWNFINGWPSKLTGPSLNAGQNEVAIEELTIVHEGMIRVK